MFGIGNGSGGMMLLRSMGIEPEELLKNFEEFRAMALSACETLEQMRLGIQDVQANQQVILLSTQRLESALTGVSPAGETAAQYEVVPLDERNLNLN